MGSPGSFGPMPPASGDVVGKHLAGRGMQRHQASLTELGTADRQHPHLDRHLEAPGCVLRQGADPKRSTTSLLRMFCFTVAWKSGDCFATWHTARPTCANNLASSRCLRRACSALAWAKATRFSSSFRSRNSMFFLFIVFTKSDTAAISHERIARTPNPP